MVPKGIMMVKYNLNVEALYAEQNTLLEPNNFIPFLIFNRRLGLGEDLLIVVLTMSEEDLRSRLAFRHSGDESIQAIMMVWNLVPIFEINFSLNRKLPNFA